MFNSRLFMKAIRMLNEERYFCKTSFFSKEDAPSLVKIFGERDSQFLMTVRSINCEEDTSNEVTKFLKGMSREVCKAFESSNTPSEKKKSMIELTNTSFNGFEKLFKFLFDIVGKKKVSFIGFGERINVFTFPNSLFVIFGEYELGKKEYDLTFSHGDLIFWKKEHFPLFEELSFIEKSI